MNTDQLHITNGDGAANIIKASSVGGDVLPWRDPMHHGPFPANLDLDAIGNIRAEYLAGTGLDAKEVRHDFRLRNEHLRTAPRYSEVVLWFEHDLLDQLQILELLNWFSEADIGSTVLTIICINEFPGFPGFRGIGQLNSEQVESLLPNRVLITPVQLQLAKSAWSCFRSDDPRRLEKFIHTDTSALPFLKTALQRHFQEYPWVSDGLTRTERQILTTVSSGMVKPTEVFVENMEIEDALYIGDWPTYQIIAKLCSLETPLLSCSPDGTFRCPPENDITPGVFRRQTLSLTDAGRGVLVGTHHARTLIARDDWLGGVHLNSDNSLWMWDGASSRLMLV